LSLFNNKLKVLYGELDKLNENIISKYITDIDSLKHIDDGMEAYIYYVTEHTIFKHFGNNRTYRNIKYLYDKTIPGIVPILELVFDENGFIGYIAEKIDCESNNNNIYKLCELIDKFITITKSIENGKVDIYLYYQEFEVDLDEFHYDLLKKIQTIDFETVSPTFLQLIISQYDNYEFDDMIKEIKTNGLEELYNQLLFIINNLISNNIYCLDIKSDAFGMDSNGILTLVDLGYYYHIK